MVSRWWGEPVHYHSLFKLMYDSAHGIWLVPVLLVLATLAFIASRIGVMLGACAAREMRILRFTGWRRTVNVLRWFTVIVSIASIGNIIVYFAKAPDTLGADVSLLVAMMILVGALKVSDESP